MEFRRRQANERLMFVLLCCMSVYFSSVNARCGRLWMKPRSCYWWDDVVLGTFTSDDWLTNFRMSKSTFDYVCLKLSPHIGKSDTVMRKAIEPKKRVALTLWFLATGVDFRTVGHLFGVSKSSVCLIVKEICNTIVKYLLPHFIKFPTGSLLMEVVSG